MTALIVVFITLSLMGSALWIKPSRRDREIMTLRALARKHSLLVQLTSVALPDKWDKVTTKVSVCAYRKYRAKPLRELSGVTLYPYEIWKHNALGQYWFASREIELDAETVRLLERYHDIFEAVEVAPEGVSIFWKERGDERTIQDIDQLIEILLLLR